VAKIKALQAPLTSLKVLAPNLLGAYINNYMSVRAYKVLDIKTAKDPSFNLWHDDAITDLIDSDQLDANGGGLVELSRNDIETRIKEYKKQGQDASLLKSVLKDFGDEDYCQYYCF